MIPHRSVPAATGRFLPAQPVFGLIGLAVKVCALFPAIWARRHPERNGSARIAIKVDYELIRTGPYSRIRHLIYTAPLGMFARSVIVIGDVFGAFACFRNLRREEKNLSVTFGPVWGEYQNSTWALLPGLY